MDQTQQYVAVTKPLKLDPEHYGFWKVSITQSIQSIDVDAWVAVEDGWTAPTKVDEKGATVPKPRRDWTTEEKAAAKANSQALSVIFRSLPVNQFTRVQGCTSAKEAWDILQVTFEGTTNVKRTRLDMLASQFENLTMGDEESINDFSSKISTIAQEAVVLGKRYKDKKLVKKFLRSLPEKFQPHRSAIDVSLNSDELKFDQVVGMMQAYELQIKKKDQPAEKSFALKSSEPQESITKEDVGLLVRKYYRKLQQGSRKSTSSFTRTDAEKDNRKSEKQCLECEGYGHFKADCPTLKKRNMLRCYECKGLGHTKAECVGKVETKQKSYITWSESESDEEESAGEELLNNFIAHIGIIEEGEDSDTSSIGDQVAETDDKEVVTTDDHIKLLMNMVEKKKENLDLISERGNLLLRISILEKALSEEKNKSSGLEKQLSDQMKNIRMLSKGTKDLDSLLSHGRVGSTPWGLGYNGGTSSGTTKFVKGKGPVAESSVEVKRTGQGQEAGTSRQGQYAGYSRSQTQWVSGTQFYRRMRSENTHNQVPSRSRRRGCWYCGDLRHYKADCYSFLNHQKQMYQQRMQQKPVRHGYVRREGLYCQVAYISEESVEGQKPWYFDSGCSRHMTGAQENLTNFEGITAGRVTFGDGAKGKIKGKGVTKGETLPQLQNVYLVDGLKANLISISQLCDEGLDVTFTNKDCKALDQQGNVLLEGHRSVNNCYVWKPSTMCLNVSTKSEAELWHQRLGHLNVRTMLKLANQEVVRGLPKLKVDAQLICGPCNKGKQVRVQHRAVQDVKSKQALDLLHMDLMGPIKPPSLKNKRFILVIVDDFTRYTWVRFLHEKSDALESFRILALQLNNEKWGIKAIRSDHGGEFKSESFDKFCHDQGIAHQYSAPRTPQQNGVVERKNRTLQEMARAMLHGNQVSQHLWDEAVNTACYIINRVYIRKGTNMTPYELWRGKTPFVGYFHVFGCVCYILNDKDHLGKFDSKSDEGLFMGYSGSSAAYRVYNKRARAIQETVNVVFDDSSLQQADDIIPLSPSGQDKESVTDDAEQKQQESESDSGDSDRDADTQIPTPTQVHRNHSSTDVIGEIQGGRVTRGKTYDYKKLAGKRQSARHGVTACADGDASGASQDAVVIQFACFVSTIEPKNHNEALIDEYWIAAMQDELEQFRRSDVWDLTPRPENVNVVGTKWVFKNKIDESGLVVRNKARLVAQGYSQVEGVDFDETFAPVARLESIRFLFGMACVLKFKLHQMDVKSAFLNGVIEEEVYVEQPKGFVDSKYPDHVYKLKKALYGLKQAPRAWYERLATFLMKQGYTRGNVDKTLFLSEGRDGLIIVQIYVDDIVFGSTNQQLVDQFVKSMTQEFEMSMCGELTYFLGLQIRQDDDGIFVSQSTYANSLVEKFGLKTSKESKIPMGVNDKLSKDESGEDVDEKLYRGMIGSLLYLTASRPDLCLSVGVCARYQAKPKMSHLLAVKKIIKYVKGTANLGIYYTKDTNKNLVGYCDADWAGSVDDRRSTSGGCFFMGNNLISWHSKKQNSVSLSTAEAEYIALGSCCTQLMWMKQMAADYGMVSDSLLVHCDNKSAINISKNPVQHSRTKHIDIRHHFIRELVEAKLIVVDHVSTDFQLADLFTKPLDFNRFVNLRKSIGVCEI